MYVYTGDDFVSEGIIKLGLWEHIETKALYYALTEHIKKKNIPKDNAVFMDIGANVGWYTFYMAALGYKVVSFEPGPKNIYIMRKTMCLNPQLNVVLIPKGVSDKEIKCKIVSALINLGNGITRCDPNYQLEKDYALMGEIHIVKLDIFARYFHEIRGIKMDIEGFEPLALKGGKQIFFGKNTQLLIME